MIQKSQSLVAVCRFHVSFEPCMLLKYLIGTAHSEGPRRCKALCASTDSEAKQLLQDRRRQLSFITGLIGSLPKKRKANGNRWCKPMEQDQINDCVLSLDAKKSSNYFWWLWKRTFDQMWKGAISGSWFYHIDVYNTRSVAVLHSSSFKRPLKMF